MYQLTIVRRALSKAILISLCSDNLFEAVNDLFLFYFFFSEFEMKLCMKFAQIALALSS